MFKYIIKLKNVCIYIYIYIDLTYVHSLFAIIIIIIVIIIVNFSGGKIIDVVVISGIYNSIAIIINVNNSRNFSECYFWVLFVIYIDSKFLII